MPRKQFDCNNCGGVHERPINSKCKMNNTLDKNNDQDLVLKDSNDTNALILNKLKNLSSSMTAMESKVDGASYSPHTSDTSTRHTPEKVPVATQHHVNIFKRILATKRLIMRPMV